MGTHSKYGTTEIYRRKIYILRTYGNGFTARCVFCPKMLTYETLTVDRIIPGKEGGTYRRSNTRPACGPCNHRDGGQISLGKRLPLLLPYPACVMYPENIPLDPGHPGMNAPGRISHRAPRGIAPKHRSRLRRPERVDRTDRDVHVARTRAWLERLPTIEGQPALNATPIDPEAEQRLEALRMKYANPTNQL